MHVVGITLHIQNDYTSISRVSDVTLRGSVVGSITLVTLCASLDNTCTLVVVVGSMWNVIMENAQSRCVQEDQTGTRQILDVKEATGK